MTFEWWFAYLLTSLILSLSPGIRGDKYHDHLNQPRLSRRGGFYCRATDRASAFISWWCVGLGTLFFPFAVGLEILKWAGAAYLIWPAFSSGERGFSRSEYPCASSRAAANSLSARCSSTDQPKSIVFLAELFPAGRPHYRTAPAQVMQYLVLGVTTIVVDIIVMIGYSTLAQRIAAWIQRAQTDEGAKQGFWIAVMLVGACWPPRATPDV